MNQSWGGTLPNPSPHTEPGLTPAVTHDAVVIVPGIMGSELYDTTTDKVIWGLTKGRWLAKAWLTRDGLTPLQLTPNELAGDYTRIQARRLLQIPAWSPFLRGIEPYHKLIRTIENTIAHPDALMTFPYDWRLPVAVNGRRLAHEARNHLQRWLAHPAHTAARQRAVDEKPARLVFIAHSMGGLVTYAALTLGGDNDLPGHTRGVMTLGTPFKGSVVAANILNAIQGAPLPLPHTRLATAAATMPAVHELLPSFLCLEDGLDIRHLTPSDIADLGGDKDLAKASQDFFTTLYNQQLPHHRPVVGIRQDTVQSLKIINGIVYPSEYCFRTDTDGEIKRDPNGVPRRYRVWGDGTVHRESASLLRRTIPVFAQHGAIANGREARRIVSDFLLEDDHLGPDQAEDGIGLNVPDYVTPDAAWDCLVSGTDDPSQVECTIAATEGDWHKNVQFEATDDDRLRAKITLPDQGLYRITAKSDYGPTVTQLVFSGPGQEHLDD
ncbi:esterase/lipase family protein [Streptomyces sp. NPDC007905]|uniref:esterase/lipase family protein n=1 Tax=Streptomyces sp. NPDC007905 TaxID=3364788 RepID=UPI0036EA142F